MSHVFVQCSILPLEWRLTTPLQSGPGTSCSVCVLFSVAVFQVCYLSPPGDVECPLPSVPVCLPSYYCTGHCQPLDADVQVCWRRKLVWGRGGEVKVFELCSKTNGFCICSSLLRSQSSHKVDPTFSIVMAIYYRRVRVCVCLKLLWVAAV